MSATPRRVRVLHVEDDAVQQKLLAAMLGRVPGLEPHVTTAVSEDAAVAAFPAGFDLVVLDYQLEQGDGLSCLRRLRALDREVPIVALSGAATPEVAAELLVAGADDFFAKDAVQSEPLGQSVLAALARHDAWKQRVAPAAESDARVGELFEKLGAEFAGAMAGGLLAHVDEFERSVRGAKLTFLQVHQMFDALTERLDAGRAAGSSRRELRPLMLELLLRLFGDASVPGH